MELFEEYAWYREEKVIFPHMDTRLSSAYVAFYVSPEIEWIERREFPIYEIVPMRIGVDEFEKFLSLRMTIKCPESCFFSLRISWRRGRLLHNGVGGEYIQYCI